MAGARSKKQGPARATVVGPVKIYPLKPAPPQTQPGTASPSGSPRLLRLRPRYHAHDQSRPGRPRSGNMAPYPGANMSPGRGGNIAPRGSGNMAPDGDGNRATDPGQH